MPWISRRRSLIEAGTNTAINFIVTPLLWYFFLVPVLDINVPASAHIFVVLTLATVSTARTYLVRRYFHRRNK